ncbi:MAG TPA: SLBB domain-containing protein, partial [Arachnia sp.]|nr:SLBB domain-containing protein [Arachnia sp.]
MERVDVEEVARARLAYISAGHGAIGGPRRARDDGVPDEAPRPEPVAVPPGPPEPSRAVAPARWSLPWGVTLRHLAVIAVLLLSGVGVAIAALGRSSATEVPLSPVVGTAAVVAPPGPTPSPTPRLLRVHVAGAVVRPGVVELPDGAIVRDAIDAAGGLVEGADAALLNLAAAVSDGSQVVIGTAEEPLGEVRGEAGGGGAPGGGGDGAAIDLNAATAAELVVAGASAVQVGTATFADPRAPGTVARGLVDWCARRGIDDLDTLIGAIHG